MITDNVSWVFAEIRNNQKGKPFFYRQELSGRVYLLAANRAARRMLLSQGFQNKAASMGAQIAVDKAGEGEAPVISIY